MIYSHLYQYVYFAPPKTGTSSVHYILNKYYKGYVFRKRHSMEWPAEIRDYFSFATVRNPYTQVVSRLNAGFMVDRRRKSFRNISGEILNQLFERATDAYHLTVELLRDIRIDRYIRLENLDNCLLWGRGFFGTLATGMLVLSL